MADPLTIIAVSSILGAGGQISAAAAARRSGQQEKAIYEERADKAIVEGQRGMLDVRHKKNLLASRALALSSASGGEATDPSSMGVIEDIMGEGAYREAAAMYTGEENARILRMGGQVALEEGNAKATAHQIGAFSSILSAGGAMYSKFKPPPVTVSEPSYTFDRGYKQ